jgi:hypothetical protein
MWHVKNKKYMEDGTIDPLRAGEDACMEGVKARLPGRTEDDPVETPTGMLLPYRLPSQVTMYVVRLEADLSAYTAALPISRSLFGLERTNKARLCLLWLFVHSE